MYKRRLILFVIIALLLSGCTKITNNLDDIINATMTNNDNYINTVSTGYELYIPTGVKQVVDSAYNQKLKIKNRYVYLYVDTISYYYKNKLNYKSTESYNYYYRELNFDGDVGYIGINKVEDDLFFCEVIFNYSKVEFYSNNQDLPIILANVLIIQKSIKYNDSLIAVELDSNMSEGREIKYELDSPKDAESTFSDYLQEYVPDEVEDVKLPDDD